MGEPLRLRILNLLSRGPLCVCHLMEILDCDQVKMSKQLRYMKTLNVVDDKRCAQWKIYCLSADSKALLQHNLNFLLTPSARVSKNDDTIDHSLLQHDLHERERIIEEVSAKGDPCAPLLSPIDCC